MPQGKFAMDLSEMMEKPREIYFNLEDKWYALIDRVDEKVPIHGIVDKVDRIVPSFALFLLIAILILLLLAVPLVWPGGAVVSFKATDLGGDALESVVVTGYVDGEEVFSEATNASGETGGIAVAPGSNLTIAAEKNGFQDYTETVEVEASQRYDIVLESLESKTYTVSLKDSLGQPVRSPLTLSFACRNSDVRVPADMEVVSGIATVVEPAGCDGLIVSVRGPGFELVDSVELVQTNQTIYLQEELGETGTIKTELYYGGALVSEEVTVYLYKDNGTESGLGPIESAVSVSGIAAFERPSGQYFVKTSGHGNYTAVASDVFTLSAGAEQTVSLDLEKNSIGTVKVKILDAVTGSAVDGANVLLRLGAQEIDSKTSSADSEGLVEFPVMQDTAYTVVVDHEAYCLKTVHSVGLAAAVEIELEPFTDDCGGALKVKVLNQSKQPVRNATVGLYTEDGFSLGFDTKVTDVNGEALFERVPSGDYKAFAFKETVSAWSEARHFSQRAAAQTTLTVVLVAGDGLVRVNVKDSEENPLQFSQVKFIDAYTHEPLGGGAMPVEDINGTVEIATPADKKVYIVASKEGYTNFTSIVKPVMAGSVQVFDAVLEREIIQGDIKIEYRGTYKDGKAVSVLAPGETYDALFQLRVPANRAYSEMGMHARTGKHEIMELDNLVIKKVNAPGLFVSLKSTSYDPKNGYAYDSGHLSSDEGKWVNLKWPVFSTGITEVMVEVRVKETARVGDQLPFFYRAWARKGSLYKRDPLDAELGEAESIAGKEALYANTRQEIFQIGTETTCDGKFCFSASILDIEDQLVYNAPESFSGSIFRPYKLNLSIQNNSEFETDSYLDSELRISNPETGLLLQSYEFYGAQNQRREGVASEDSTDWIETGNLLPKNIASGWINFTPQKSGLSTIKVELRSGQRIRFRKTISLSIMTDKEMEVVVTPGVLPSGIENSITVTAKDAKTGAELENALAKVKDRFSTVVAEKFTNKKGIAVLRLPALQPGEKLQLVAGKPDYETFEKTLEVNPSVIEVKPERIGVKLNAKTIFESSDPFTIENIASFVLSIKSLELNGRLYGLIDREKANNWLYSYVGEEIKPGQDLEMELRTFLTEKGKRLAQPRNLEASLDITTQAFGSEWLTTIPVKINIGLGGEVDDPTCFAITAKEWKASTEGTPIEIQFEVQNNCSISGTPVTLKNVSAKVEWESNQTGTFSVRTETNALQLQGGYPKKIVGEIGPEQSIPIVLSFSPSAGMNGKAIAGITFSAENPTQTGLQTVEDSLAAELVVVNLTDCIVFGKEVLRIKPEESDTLDVETRGCGISNDFKLESDLTLSTSTFTLGEDDSIGVEVLAEKNMPGQYPIDVYAKGSDELEHKLIKTIRVRILSDGCLDLSKYEFDIFDNPDDPFDGYDTAELYNNCYDQHVTANVKFDEHDWMEAMKTGALVGLVTGLLGGIMAETEGADFFTGKPDSETEKEMTYGEFLKGQGKSLEIQEDTKGRRELTKDGTEVFFPDGSNAGKDRQGNTYIKDGGTIKKVKDSSSSTGDPSYIPTGLSSGQIVNSAGMIEQLKKGGMSPGTPFVRDGITVIPFTLNGSPGEAQRNESSNENWTITYNIGAETTGSFALGTGLQFMGGGGGMGGMLGGTVLGMGKTLFGQPSFLGWGLMGFIGGTLWAYSQQEEGEFQVNVIKEDLVIKNVELFLAGAMWDPDAGNLSEVPSEDIIVQDLGETSTEPREDDPRLSVESRRIGFWNVDGTANQKDPSKPHYRVLRVDGERLVWETEYELDEETTPELTVKERKDYKERFRVQFNAFDPLKQELVSPPIANCTLGTITGNTGPDAVPKVSYDWSWAKIKQNSCDEENEDYIYCDATQFSIAVLKKIHELAEFIEANKPFECPTSASNVAVKNQPMVSTAYDVGITRIQATKVGEDDANVSVVVESNNGQPMQGEVTINVMQGTSLIKSCTKDMDLISKVISYCEFEGLSAGSYTVEAEVTPALCAECENNDADNDTIDAKLVIGTTGVGQCEPFNTSRLTQFLEASGYAQNEIEKVQSLVKFNAYLMEDAYTKDFKADFDEFCKTKSFFDCPDYYNDESYGLQRFFSDDERFEFDYSLGQNAPVDAGKYSVTINIEFENSNWDMFVNGMPDATIAVKMNELSAPEPNSPFYYLPIDGLVGVDSENGRQGYGVNFRQTSEETIKINDAIDQTILSTNIAGSTPIRNGWIEAGLNEDFVSLNQLRRGILLDLQASGDTAKLVMSPSYATPVMMQIDWDEGMDAYGFYSVEVDNSPQAAAQKMVPWSGIGLNCRDLHDNAVTAAWDSTWDKHGGISGNLQCAIGTQITDYGIEFCNPIRSGSVFLQSVVFTPQGKDSLMKRTVYSDEMILYNAGDKGTQVSLNGVPGMRFNSYGTSGIGSVEDIFDLVRENKVCIIGQGNRIRNQFFWNPKVVLEELANQRNIAEAECIPPR